MGAARSRVSKESEVTRTGLSMWRGLGMALVQEVTYAGYGGMVDVGVC